MNPHDSDHLLTAVNAKFVAMVESPLAMPAGTMPG